ncbi:O-unit flippase-like protein [uncultured Draconibacterium sp.]|uniref:O-unit flippase-like protein n=1 Tax=uncultured Draconibacterium sp. TaxID=1573823 RepID=UPI0029C6B3F7|nr:O-unit flippase-like protein [uncultured Draconibacterium sp.]
MIKLTKQDIRWGYFASFFNIGAGMIVLPLVLSMLSAEEIGMNYLMLTVGTLVALFDFGFAPQLGRNLNYVFSGAQNLTKEGVEIIEKGDNINYQLLATTIHTARYVYMRLALIVLITMLTFGTLYIYQVTNGFKNVEYSFIIWILYSISTFTNIYFTYYSSLLLGKGLIKESKKAKVFGRLTYVFLAAVLLILGFGLLAVVIANMLAPFVKRYLSYKYFFTSEFKSKLEAYNVTKKQKIELFNIIWYNTKKLGLVFIAAYVVTRFGLFIAGLFLSLSEIASYGLMMQLVQIITGLSGTLFTIYQPRFSSLRVQGDNHSLMKEFAFSMNIRYIIYLVGIVSLIIIGPWALQLIGSNAELPSSIILVIYSLVILLEANHGSFASIIVTKNDVPFVKPSLITGAFIILGCYLSLQYTTLGILGLILVQGLAQLAYSNWKWPDVVCKEFKVDFLSFLKLGFNESYSRFKVYLYERN